MLLRQLLEGTLHCSLVHGKCYLGDLRDVIGSYLHILGKKGMADLVIEIIFSKLEVVFLKPTYQ